MLDGRVLVVRFFVVKVHFALIENDLARLNRGRLERFELLQHMIPLVEREIGADRLVIRSIAMAFHVGDGGETLTGR